jgi:hypothetical protein
VQRQAGRSAPPFPRPFEHSGPLLEQVLGARELANRLSGREGSSRLPPSGETPAPLVTILQRRLDRHGIAVKVEEVVEHDAITTLQAA